MDFGTLLGAIIGAGTSLAATYWALGHQAKEQRQAREAEARRERHARLEQIYIAMLARATESRNMLATKEERDRRREQEGLSWPAFMLLAPGQVRNAFDRCRDLWWDFLPGDEYDEGTDEMHAAVEELRGAMREHLADLLSQPSLPTPAPTQGRLPPRNAGSHDPKSVETGTPGPG